ncbi:MAG: hypothetical protein ACR2RD_11860 [Woeseiaceae bacterium]
MSVDNAQNASIVAMSLSEGMLQLAGLAHSAIIEASESDALQFSSSCPNGGLVDFDLTDVDQDLKPSPGDSLRVTYRDCEVVELNGTAAGDFVVDLTSPLVSPAAGEIVFAGSIDPTNLTIFSTPVANATVNDVLVFEVRKDRLTESIMIGGDASITVDDGSTQITESLAGFEFRKDQSFETARYTLQAQGLIDSSLLGGTFEFDTTGSISGYLNTYPEQGRYELIGRDDSRVAIIPNFVISSSEVNIEVDANGNGTFVAVNQPFWSELVEGFLWWYKEESPTRYQARTYNANDFFVILYTPGNEEEASVNTEMRIQFSRPIDPAGVPAALNAQLQLQIPPYLSENVELDVEIVGAALLLTPREQLRHGFRVYYPIEFFNVEDEFQNTTAVFGSGFITADTLSSQPVASSPLGISGDTITLDGSASVALGDNIVAYSWTQLTGTPGLLGNSDQANADFVVPALSGAELVEVQLEVTNSAGEYDREIVEISAFESQQSVQVVSFTGDETDYISAGLNWILTSANGQFTVGRNFDNGVSLQHDRTQPSFTRWNLEFAAAGDAEIGVGAYENATRFPFQATDENGLSLFGDGRGCNQLAGRFDVHEISYDVNGDVLTAAIDFEQTCDGSAGKAVGSVRLGSAVPIPGP